MFTKANLSKHALVKSPRSKLASWGGVFLLILTLCLCAVCYAQSNANASQSVSNDNPRTTEDYDFYMGDNWNSTETGITEKEITEFTTSSDSLSPTIQLNGTGNNEHSKFDSCYDDVTSQTYGCVYLENPMSSSDKCYFKIPKVNGYKLTSVSVFMNSWLESSSSPIVYISDTPGDSSNLIDSESLAQYSFSTYTLDCGDDCTDDLYLCFNSTASILDSSFCLIVSNIGLSYEQAGPSVSITGGENHSTFQIDPTGGGSQTTQTSITGGFKDNSTLKLNTDGILTYTLPTDSANEDLPNCTITAVGSGNYKLKSWTIGINGTTTTYVVGVTETIDLTSSGGPYTLVANYDEPWTIYGKVYEMIGTTKNPVSGVNVEFIPETEVTPVLNDGFNDFSGWAYSDTTDGDGSYEITIGKSEKGSILFSKNSYVLETTESKLVTEFDSQLDMIITKVGETVNFNKNDENHASYEYQFYLNGNKIGDVQNPEQITEYNVFPAGAQFVFSQDGVINYSYTYGSDVYTATITPCTKEAGYRVASWIIDNNEYKISEGEQRLEVGNVTGTVHNVGVKYELAATGFFVTPYMFDPGFSWLEVMYCKVGQWPIVRYMPFFYGDVPAGATYKVDWLNNLVIDYDWDTTNAVGDQYVVISAVPSENYELLYWSGSYGFPIIPWQTYTVEAGENYVFHPNFAKMLGHVNAEVSGEGSGSFYVKYYEAGEEVYEEYTNVLDADAFAGIKFDIDDKNLITIYAKYDVESGKLIDNGEDNYIVVAAVANEGSQFAGWTINGEQITEPKNYTVEGYNSYKGLAVFDLVPQPGPVPGPDPVDPVNPDDPGNINNPANTSDYTFAWALDLAIIALAFGALMYRRKTTK